ncbi:MAG: hypothetical protein OEZ54_03930 [Gemmatimonadota bacterium]|nr:hypothetical protein [Gemmatimonadota bacterium]
MDNHQMARIEGGEAYTACGFAVGATAASFLFSPLLGLYLTSKAIGVCAIELALNN